LTTSAISGAYTVTNEEALEAWHALAADSRIRFCPEPLSLADHWLQDVAWPRSSPKLWNDGYLASFAISIGMRFVTFDQGFKQFRDSGLDLLLLS
jgi:predicted nucleic acid-binding protein